MAKQLNQPMLNYCTSTLECAFVDVATALLDTGGHLLPAYYASDRVHLSAAGYAVRNGVVRPALMAGEATDTVQPALEYADAAFAAARGSLAASGGFVDVEGSGVGTQGLLLYGFRYGYRQLSGKGQVTVRLTNRLDPGANPLAGVMIRERLTPESGYAFVYSTPCTETSTTYAYTVIAYDKASPTNTDQPTAPVTVTAPPLAPSP